MGKIYVIRYKAYEFDDLDTGSYDPIFISLDKDKVKEKFEDIKQNDINNLNRIVDRCFGGSAPEDYQVEEDTTETFELWLGNWCYRYYIEEYDLDVDLLYMKK